MSKTVILGAGPTGLGAATRLHELGNEDWVLIEQSSLAGGLASSFVDEHGFTWDIGGHVQFSHYEYFDQSMKAFLGEDGWLHHERESWVWIRDRFIPYPFQNNIRRLPKEDLIKCLEGLVDLQSTSVAPPPTNFAEWIKSKFGSGIAEVFMLPYNFKVWAHPSSEMNCEWVGERVAVTDLKRVLRNIVHETDDLSWGPNNTFQFPVKGGTGAIWKACASRLPQSKLFYQKEITSVDLKSKTVKANTGEVFAYDHLISTIPLTALTKLTGDSSLHNTASKGLSYSSSNIIGLGLRGQPSEALEKKCWMYFPEKNCPFYRVTVFSNYSPYNVPDITTHWSLMAEVSESGFKSVNHERLVDDVIEGALNTSLISDRESIVSVWQYHAKHGYPIPSLSRDKALEYLIPTLESYGIYSRGRFGMWKYEVSNQDHSFMQGVEVVERLYNNQAELTAFYPNVVNSTKQKWPFEGRK